MSLTLFRRFPAQYYDVLNFNDVPLGFMPFVTSLVAAGPSQPVIDAFGVLGPTSDRGWNVFISRTFFLSYYYSAQLIILNVFISYVISAYSLQKGKDDARRADNELRARRRASGAAPAGSLDGVIDEELDHAR